MTDVRVRLAAVACVIALGAAWADTAVIDGREWTYSLRADGAVVERQGNNLAGDVRIPAALGGRPVVGVADYAFYENQLLRTVVVPSGVRTIGRAAFYECGGLSTVVFPDGLQEIGPSAFYGCAQLQSVSVPSGVTEIGEAAFASCRGLKAVTIASGVREIGASAFAGCVALPSVRIPSSVMSVGPYAFFRCSALEQVTIESQATVVGNFAFLGCPWSGESAEGPSVDAMDRLVSVSVAFVNSDRGQESAPAEEERYDEPEDDPTVLRVVQGDKVEWGTGLTAYSVKGLPTGLKYNKKTGVISGIAKKATVASGAVVTFTKKGVPNETRTVFVVPEEISVSCPGLTDAEFIAGVAGGAEGIPVFVETQSGIKSVRVSKLPSGMKYNSKTGCIEGAPKKGGTFAVKISVTAKSGSVQAFEAPITVKSLPVWATGTFGGLIGRFAETGDADSWLPYGSVTLKVATMGKITGKVLAGGKTYSFSATGFDSVDENGDFHFRMTTRKGDVYEGTLAGRRLDILQVLGADSPHGPDGSFTPASGSPYDVSVWRNEHGKDGRLAADQTGRAKRVMDAAKKVKTVKLGEYDPAFGSVQLKIAANGTTRVSGKLADGTKASGSSFLMLDGGDYHVLTDMIFYDKASKSVCYLPLCALPLFDGAEVSGFDMQCCSHQIAIYPFE